MHLKFVEVLDLMAGPPQATQNVKPFDIEKARKNLKKRREIAGQERERLFLKAEAD